MNIRKPPHELSLAEWHRVIDTNLTSAHLCSHHLPAPPAQSIESSSKRLRAAEELLTSSRSALKLDSSSTTTNKNKNKSEFNQKAGFKYSEVTGEVSWNNRSSGEQQVGNTAELRRFAAVDRPTWTALGLDRASRILLVYCDIAVSSNRPLRSSLFGRVFETKPHGDGAQSPAS
jgi:hypothetical protein